MRQPSGDFDGLDSRVFRDVVEELVAPGTREGWRIWTCPGGGPAPELGVQSSGKRFSRAL